MFSFNPFPILETERLTFRKLSLADDKEIFFFRSDDELIKYTAIKKAESLEDARKHIELINALTDEGKSILWGICEKGSNKVIGTICIWNISIENMTGEVGYMLHQQAQGKGYMSEALLAVMQYGFDTMKLNVIEAAVDPENGRSVKLLMKYGYKFDKKTEDGIDLYTLDKEDYYKRALDIECLVFPPISIGIKTVSKNNIIVSIFLLSYFISLPTLQHICII